MAAILQHDLTDYARPPAVVGVGDPLRADEAVGLHILGELREFMRSWLGRVEFVDATLPGHAPSELLRGRAAMVLVGSLARGGAPGSVHVLSGRDAVRMRRGHPNAAPAGNTVSLLRTLRVVDALPRTVTVIGVEPGRLERGMGLSDAVREALPAAGRQARVAVEAMSEAEEARRGAADLGPRAIAG